jgi:MarR family transcriptional regulator, organic hydroperoxide resistance regulator
VTDPQTDWLSDEFQTVFWAAKRAMKEAADTAYQRHGVREGQQFILMCLWDEDALTPGEIATRLGLATPTVTKATTRMQAAGLVSRGRHPTDARLVRIHLTERGRALQKILDEEMLALSERALNTFSDREKRDFVHFLDQLRRNLTRPAADA